MFYPLDLDEADARELARGAVPNALLLYLRDLIDAADIRRGWDLAPDRHCLTAPDGSCEGKGSCMHTPSRYPVAPQTGEPR